MGGARAEMSERSMSRGWENHRGRDVTRIIPGARPAGCLRQSKMAILPFCRTRVRIKSPITA